MAIEVIGMENERNPWQERFTWFWFCEDEILRYTDEDFRRRAKELHDRGITVAINFSLTHFRFGYYKYWNVINAAFRKFVDACHEYGIRVVEHHSASLVPVSYTHLDVYKRQGLCRVGTQ